MTIKKHSLGKVFLSHSSKDKAFVRRFAKRLWKEGYQVWLDEKELVPGDALGSRISDTLKQSSVVFVVVTEHSVGSRWVRFELNKAVERMVDGTCRIIPVLKGPVELPSELVGLIYADFRKSFAKGFRSVLAALEAESKKAVSKGRLRLESLAETVFGTHGFASISGEYKLQSYEFVCVKGVNDSRMVQGSASIVLDVVHDYGDKAKPIEEEWWDEYRTIQEQFGEIHHLILTERPVNIPVFIASLASPRVKYLIENNGISFVVIIADVSSLPDVEDQTHVLCVAKQEFTRISKELDSGDVF